MNVVKEHNNQEYDKNTVRTSQDEKSSSADSDASYDLVSGVTSRTPGTPMMVPAATSAPVGKKDESDDEDWE